MFDVYLADEAWKVTMSKIFRKYFFGEGDDILDDKAYPIFFPTDHVLKLRMLRMESRCTSRIS